MWREEPLVVAVGTPPPHGMEPAPLIDVIMNLLKARPHMKRPDPTIGMFVAIALVLIASWPMPISAEEGGECNDKVRVAVINFENNSSWRYWGDNLGYAAADELVTQLFRTQKFSLVERTQLEAVVAEQTLVRAGGSIRPRLPKWGESSVCR
jgi:hypothetical protein